jgi:hypothetical protein
MDVVLISAAKSFVADKAAEPATMFFITDLLVLIFKI